MSKQVAVEMFKELVAVEQAMEVKEAKEDLWPGRYYVEIVATSFPHPKELFHNVNFSLFRAPGDMPDSEVQALVEPYGLSQSDAYLRSYVEQTFDLQQALALVAYFVDWPVAEICIKPARKPRENVIGVGAYPVGGAENFYMFSEHDDYPLAFKVWGYYDLEDCPEWKEEMRYLHFNMQDILAGEA